MTWESSPSGLEIWPPVREDAVHRPECVTLPVGVFNPPEANALPVRFQMAFVCVAGLRVFSVETRRNFSNGTIPERRTTLAMAAAQTEDGRMRYAAAEWFALAPREFERFYVTFCRNLPFEPGEIVAFAVQVCSASGTSERNLRFRL